MMYMNNQITGFDINQLVVHRKKNNQYEDVTENVEYVYEDKAHYHVRYNGNDTEYLYSKRNLLIFSDPEIIKGEDVWVREGDNIINKKLDNTQFIYSFDQGRHIRYVLDTGEWKYKYNEEPVEMDITLQWNYIKEIAKLSVDITENESTQENKDSFMVNSLNKVQSMCTNSVLYFYLKRRNLQSRSLEDNTIIYPFDFNLSQKKAVEDALTNPVSMIQGPPGTGKTQTILNLIANLITIQNKSVIVVSNNNAAVENIEDKLKEEHYGCLTALLGNRKKQKAFWESERPQPDLESWAFDSEDDLERRNIELQEQLEILMKIKQAVQLKKQELSKWKIEQEHFENSFADQLDSFHEVKMPARCYTSDQIMEFYMKEILYEEGKRLNRFVYHVNLFFKYRLNPFYIPGRPVQMKLQRKYYNQKITELENEIHVLQKQLEQRSFEDILNEYKSVSRQLFNKYLHKRYENRTHIEINQSNFKVKYTEFLRECPIVLSTTYSALDSMKQDYMFDYAIIDESSQCDLVSAMPIMSRCRNIVVVGDEKQLDCIRNMNIMKKLENHPIDHRYNFFKENLMSSFRKVFENQLPMTVLLEHYRCSPKIIQFCNERYYDGKLIAYTKEDPDVEPMILFRTVEGNHARYNTNPESRGRFNQREIDCVKEEIIEKCGISKEDKVGFITPFRLQAEKAEKQLKDQVESDTVHKFQGRAKDIIIFSTVLDMRSGRGEKDFVEDKRLINVAVSRAKKQFILETHPHAFDVNEKEINALIEYIQYNFPHNSIHSEVVSIFDLLYKEHSEKLERYRKRLNQKYANLSDEQKKGKYKSQGIMKVLIEEVLQQQEFELCDYREEIFFYNLCSKKEKEIQDMLSEEEYIYYNQKSQRVDFVIHKKMNEEALLVVEVDGYEYHENKRGQLEIDKMRDSIIRKFGLPVLRFATNGSNEKKKLEQALRNCLLHDDE